MLTRVLFRLRQIAKSKSLRATHTLEPFVRKILRIVVSPLNHELEDSPSVLAD